MATDHRPGQSPETLPRTAGVTDARLVAAEVCADVRRGELLDVAFDRRSALLDARELLLLDGAKALYSDVLDLVERRLRTGALIVADNADHCPEFLDRVRSSNGYLSLPFADDVELSMKTA